MERYIENREARRPDLYTRAEEVVKVVLAAALKLSVCGAAGMVIPVLCGAPFTPALWLSGCCGILTYRWFSRLIIIKPRKKKRR